MGYLIGSAVCAVNVIAWLYLHNIPAAIGWFIGAVGGLFAFFESRK